MTYYEQLVRNARRAMDRHPRSTVLLDAETLELIASTGNPEKAAAHVEAATARGRVPVVLQKPRKPESWIL